MTKGRRLLLPPRLFADLREVGRAVNSDSEQPVTSAIAFMLNDHIEEYGDQYEGGTNGQPLAYVRGEDDDE